jgi:hypothetical protein
MSPFQERLLLVHLGQVDGNRAIEFLALFETVSSFLQDIEMIRHFADADVSESGSLATVKEATISETLAEREGRKDGSRVRPRAFED